MGEKNLFEELKQRRVFRATAVYIVVALGVVEAANNFFPALELPPWTLKFVVILAVLGLPVTIALSWVFDVRSPETARGSTDTTPVPGASANFGAVDVEPPQRRDAPASHPGAPTPPPTPRWTAGRIAVVGAVVVLALAGAAMVFIGGGDGPPALDNRVAVLPFENRTGDADLDDLGLVAADFITDGLSGIDEVHAILAKSRVDPDSLLQVNRNAQTGLAVTGSYVLVGDSIEIRARLVDPRERRVLLSFDPARSHRSTPTTGLGPIRQKVSAGVAARLHERLHAVSATSMQTDGPPASYEAYRAYLAGADLFLEFRYREAIRELDRAVEADSGFIDPLALTYSALVFLGQPTRADSVLRLIEPHRSRLSDAGRMVLEIARALQEGDLSAAYRAAKEWVDRAPGNLERFYAATLAMGINRPHEALELLEAVPVEGRHRIAAQYYEWYGYTLYALGRHQREVDAAREWRQILPDWPPAIEAEARALIALGRPQEAAALVDDLVSLPPILMSTSARLLEVGDALVAHGYAEAAERVYRRSLTVLEAQGPPEDPSVLVEWARVMKRIGRLDEAAKYAERSHEADPANRRAHALIGIIAAQRGDREYAEQIAAQLAARDDHPYVYGQNTYNRGCIRAQLGDLDRAVELLRQAFAEGAWMSEFRRLDPDLAPLEGHPGFEDLLRPRG